MSSCGLDMKEANRTSASRIQPEKITRPIQLLAVWFVALTVIDGTFLVTARTVSIVWIQGMLVLASIINVYVFVFCLYRLQTRFRREIQEDSYYSKSLGKRQISTAALTQIKRSLSESRASTFVVLEKIQAEIASLSSVVVQNSQGVPQLVQPLQIIAEQVDRTEAALEAGELWGDVTIYLNDLLPQYGEIKQSLLDSGISVFETFGSTSRSAHVPAVFSIAFGRDLGIEVMQEMLRRALVFGAEVTEIANEALDWDLGHVYMGSYGFEYNTVAELTPELTGTLLSANLDPRRFFEVIRKNSTSKRVAEFKKAPD